LSGVFLANKPWTEVKDIVGTTEVVLLPTGSIEQHGPALPLKHDYASALYVAAKAAEELYPKVMVAPSIPFGFTPNYLPSKFPGTISLKPETFINIIFEICYNLKKHGFRKIFIVNGHGGNHAVLKIAVGKIHNELGLYVGYASYWDLIPSNLGKQFHYAGHAALFETATALYTHPELTKKEAIRKPDCPPPASYPDLFIKCSFSSPWSKFVVRDAHEFTQLGIVAGKGDPTKATAKDGEKLIKAAVRGLVSLLNDIISK
jgi:creatinine amidohydrolase